MSSIHDIVKSLNAKKAGSNCWMALCPAHGDTNRSLAIREGDNGHVLVHCHAGCQQRDVVAALRAQGCWPESDAKPVLVRDNTPGPVVAEYFYRDEAGRVLYRITRHEPKTFRAWRPDGAGGWRAGLAETRRVLYNLPEVIANEIIFVVEGEKDADTLGDHGFIATTCVFGAGKWDHAFDPLFAEKTVVLIPDGDDAGNAHMADVADGLLEYVGALYWHEVEGAKDISDWLLDHSEVELCERLEVLFGP